MPQNKKGKPMRRKNNNGSENSNGGVALYDRRTTRIKTSQGEKKVSVHELYHLLVDEVPLAVRRDSWNEIEQLYLFTAEIVEGRDFECSESRVATQNN